MTSYDLDNVVTFLGIQTTTDWKVWDCVDGIALGNKDGHARIVIGEKDLPTLMNAIGEYFKRLQNLKDYYRNITLNKEE